MKNVLFVSDTFLEGGMETRIAEANHEYKKHHINSFLACDSFKNTIYCKDFDQISSDFHFIPTNGQLFVKNILEDSEKLITFCKKHKIDFIEAQPFWNLLPASIAAQECKIPISYTLHGTDSGNFIDPIYCEANITFYLALSFGVDQIYAVSERLSNIYRYISDNILITRNSILTNNIPKKTFHKTGSFAIASRLDTPKTALILNFLPKLYHIKHAKKIDIYGDGDNFEKLKKFVIKNHYDDKINLLGWTDNLQQQLINNQYDCIFGVGRIATDAISTKTPIGIVSFGGFAGIVNKSNLLHFAQNNFLSWDTSKDDSLQQEIHNLYKNPENYLFDKKDLQLFDASKNWEQHILSEQSLTFKNKPVIENLKKIFLNHKDEELFINSNLIDSLILLLNEYGKGKLIYAELLGHISNIATHNAYIAQMATQKQLSDLESSISWKITKPLREANRILHNIKKS